MGRKMRKETKEIIRTKFEKSLDTHVRKKDLLKKVFERFGIHIEKVAEKEKILTAYFIGILRAICYDTKAFIEAKPALWNKKQDEYKDIEEEEKERILETVRKILENIA